MKHVLVIQMISAFYNLLHRDERFLRNSKTCTALYIIFYLNHTRIITRCLWYLWKVSY